MSVQFFIVPGLGTLNNPNYTAFQFTNIVPPVYIRMVISDDGWLLWVHDNETVSKATLEWKVLASIIVLREWVTLYVNFGRRQLANAEKCSSLSRYYCTVVHKEYYSHVLRRRGQAFKARRSSDQQVNHKCTGRWRRSLSCVPNILSKGFIAFAFTYWQQTC